MEYDLVKKRLEEIIGGSSLTRKLFFAVLDRLFLRTRYIHRELRLLKNSGFSPEKILDAGSGFGQYSFYLTKLFPEAQITGLDIKSEIVASSNQLAEQFGLQNIHFEVGDLLTLNYPAQFDLVLNVDVLEHIEEDQLVMKNIASVLLPGGCFLLTTPYFDGSDSAGTSFVSEHVRPGYSRSELEDKLNAAGLSLQKFIITYGKYGAIAWRLLQKWPMSWLKSRFWLFPFVGIYLCLVYPVALAFMQLDMRTKNIKGGGILSVAVKKQ